MSDHLQLQLRDLGDQISKIVSHHSSVRAVTEERPLGGALAGIGSHSPSSILDDTAEADSATVDEDIAEVEKMLQQWLVARGKET